MITEAINGSFSFTKLCLLPLEDRITYCKKNLGEPIGKGSSRMVFQIDDNWVLKLAMNVAGARQNEAEIPDNYMDELGIFARVNKGLSDLNKYYYIVSEYVLPLEDGDCEECIGMSFDTLCDFIKQCVFEYTKFRTYCCKSWSDDEFEELMDNDKSGTLLGIYNFLTNYKNEGWGDWVREDNVGMAIRDGQPHIVFLDNGLNEDILKKHYGFFGNKGSFNDSVENGKYIPSNYYTAKELCLHKLDLNGVSQKEKDSINDMLDWAIEKYGEQYIKECAQNDEKFTSVIEAIHNKWLDERAADYLIDWYIKQYDYYNHNFITNGVKWGIQHYGIKKILDLRPDIDELYYVKHRLEKQKENVTENIRQKFNTILEKITKNYNIDKLLD